MAAPLLDFHRFTFPCKLDEFARLTDPNVCIVSFFGNSAISDSKNVLINKFLQRQLYKDDVPKGEVRGCIDLSKKLVLLDCSTGFDNHSLATLCRSAEDFSVAWDAHLHSNAVALLFALQVSHVVVCLTPGLSFDTSYIRLFRALEITRNKLHLSDEISKFGLPKAWVSSGRPVCPRMLFLFTPISSQQHINGEKQISKLERSLEDQIYNILRKTRIVTNNTNSALFSVPANQPYVHILRSDCVKTSTDHLYNLFDMYCTADKRTIDVVDEYTDSAESFRWFIMQHVDLAHGSGFNDNIGRNSHSNVFEIAKLKTWLKLASHIFTLLLHTNKDSHRKLVSVLSNLKSTLEVDQRFSESRCHKVMQLAENAYQESLPENYTAGVHQTQLAKAELVMRTSGRGPALSTYLSRLEKDCTAYWRNGHQLCESTSLSGHHCIYPLHRLPDEPITDETDKLPCSNHSTGVSYTVSCNCGRIQKDIGDPFNVKFANHTVYEEMAKECCYELESIFFPVYAQPVQPENPTEALTTSSDKQQIMLSPDDMHSKSLSGKAVSGLTVTRLKLDEDESTNMSDHRSYYLSLSQGHHDHVSVSKTIASVTDENVETISEDVPANEDSRAGSISYMVHNNSPRGLLPTYSSWALTRLGTYSSYNPSAGLDQPGFTSLTNYLLPWEVVIKGIVKDQVWPAVAEGTSQRQRKKMVPKKQHVLDTTAKIYIGDEYICPEGHRFFCSAADKVVKVVGSQVKDNANKLLTQDMPLYTLCSKCTGHVAQLRHIFVATPPIETLQVSVLPKIQPAPVPCPLFLPSHDGPVNLPSNGLWVIRLPHFYEDERGQYPLPDQQTISSCRLLKGTFSIKNTSDPLL